MIDPQAAERLETTLVAVHAGLEQARQLAAPLVRASVESLVELYPEIAVDFDMELSGNEFAASWPMVGEAGFMKSFMERRPGSLRRDPPEVAAQSPRPVYIGGPRLFAVGKAYDMLDEDNRILPEEAVPLAAARYARDLAAWIDGMAHRGHNLVLAVDFQEINHPDLRIFADTDQARAYLSILTGETEVALPDGAKPFTPDLRLSPRVAVGGEGVFEQTLRYLDESAG